MSSRVSGFSVVASSLVVAAITLWNTVYLERSISALRQQREIDDKQTRRQGAIPPAARQKIDRAVLAYEKIRFLRAPLIMRDKGSVQGINTAATLWCAAAVGVLCGTGHFGPAIAGTVLVLVTNTLLREVSRVINATPVSAADLVREYVLTVVCREDDEIHIRTLLSNSMYSQPLSFQSLTSQDLEGDPPRIEVTATVRMHPKDQAKLELMASRISMEKGVSSISWSGRETETAPE